MSKGASSPEFSRANKLFLGERAGGVARASVGVV
jgi:hypothetical protein